MFANMLLSPACGVVVPGGEIKCDVCRSGRPFGGRSESLSVTVWNHIMNAAAGKGLGQRALRQHLRQPARVGKFSLDRYSAP